MKRICKYICPAALLCAFAACTNENYPLYDTAQKDSVFFEYVNENDEIATSTEYVFNYNIAHTHNIEIPVRLMGMPVDYDRQIALEPVAGETDMVEGVHYNIKSALLPADAVRTSIVVELLRDNDPELLERPFTLTLSLEENDDLRAVGSSVFTITYSDIRPTDRPSWWVTYESLPVYSFEAAQVFFEFFYELAPAANIDVFNEMVGRYGDYFINATSSQGPFAMYTTFLEKYVLIPMYEEYGNVFEWYSKPGF